jgi:hypothetical protein
VVLIEVGGEDSIHLRVFLLEAGIAGLTLSAVELLILACAASLVLETAATAAGIVSSYFLHKDQHLIAEMRKMKIRPAPDPDPRLMLELRKVLTDPKLEPDDLLNNVELARRLLAIDQDLANLCQIDGCPKCRPGTKLYLGDYPRHPPGCPPELKPYYDKRFSFNCSNCDARVTPPSVRFLGRTWRVSLVLVLTTARGVRSVVWLASHLGVPERTVKRWRCWWQKSFVATKFWDHHRADFAPPVEHEQLPGSALVRFKAPDVVDKLIDFLRFLSPLRTQDRCAPQAV